MAVAGTPVLAAQRGAVVVPRAWHPATVHAATVVVVVVVVVIVSDPTPSFPRHTEVIGICSK